MVITRHPTAQAFLERGGPLLLEREAENNLMVSIAGGLAASEEAGPLDSEVYLATAGRGTVLACAIRTPPHKLLLTQAPEEVIEPLVRAVAQVHPELPGVLAASETSTRFAHVWARSRGVSARPGLRMRIYQLDRVVPPAREVPGGLRAATEADLDLMVEWTRAFHHELPDMVHGDVEEAVHERIAAQATFVWKDPDPVSMASSAGRTPNGVRVNNVYTPPRLRGRGYATACVAGLSQELLDAGASFCFLYTDLANPTSNSIYQRIGYRPVIDVAEHLFHSPHQG
jgi:predicted GNAT family acetyltransferase